MTTSTAVPIVNLPFLYINNLKISNNATTPNSLLDIGAGQCRDSSNVYDMTLGSSVTINSANTGLNGIDTGAVAAAKVYYVYLITDPVTANPAGCMISLALPAPAVRAEICSGYQQNG